MLASNVTPQLPELGNFKKAALKAGKRYIMLGIHVFLSSIVNRILHNPDMNIKRTNSKYDRRFSLNIALSEHYRKEISRESHAY